MEVHCDLSCDVFKSLVISLIKMLLYLMRVDRCVNWVLKDFRKVQK
jgi:hypothetical protein